MADEPKSSQSFQEFVKFGKFFSSRLVQAVVQARLGHAQFVSLPCRENTDPTDWFNVRIDELGEVTAQLRSSITRYPPLTSTLALDFLLQTTAGGVLPLETWCISYEPTEADGGKYLRTELYQQLSVVLKSVIAASRITPSYRYFVRKQSPESYIILYRISEDPVKLDFGENPKKLRIATVASPFGSLLVDLAFRTSMVFDRTSDEYGEIENTDPSTSRLRTFDPDDLDLPARIPFGPVPTSSDFVAASPDSDADAYTCFSTSPGSQHDFPAPLSPRGAPVPSSPRSFTNFRIGISPASSNESFARRGSEELLFGPCNPPQPSCSLPERTLDRRLICRTRQPSFPFATLLNASPPSQFLLNRQIFRTGPTGEASTLSSAGPSIATVGLTNVTEEELPVANLRKSSTAPVPVNLLENLQLEQRKAKQERDEDSSDDDDDVVFPMTDIFGRVAFGAAGEHSNAGPVELIQQCRRANCHQLNFLQEATDTDVNTVVDRLAEFENNSKIFDSFVSEISADREEDSFLQ